jgi:CDP-diacylglycerol--glycerol-3-phosphate 3-phosphatidyltransferase
MVVRAATTRFWHPFADMVRMEERIARSNVQWTVIRPPMLTDKALTGMALIGLSVVGEVWWWVTILVLLREWSVTLLRLSILKKVVVPAAQSGKIKTTAQAGALFWLSLPLVAADNAWGTPGEVMFYLAQGLLAIAVALTLWSGYEFYRAVWQQRHQLKAPAEENAA